MSKDVDGKTITIEVEKLRKALQVFNGELGIAENDQQRHLVGRILTIVDASISDTEQRKAIKDMVNQAVWMPAETLSSFSPHDEIRKLTEALGFMLYPERDELPTNVPIQQFNRFTDLVK